MEKSEPWRNAMMEAFNKYIVNGPSELVKTIFDTILAGARGVGKIFSEGAPILLEMIKTAATASVLNGHLLKSKDTSKESETLY